MRTHGFVGTALLVALSLFFPTVARAATPAAEKLLPADTLVVLTVPDLDKAAAAAKDFSFAQLWNDPAMKPLDRKSTRLNSSHIPLSRMPSSA